MGATAGRRTGPAGAASQTGVSDPEENGNEVRALLLSGTRVSNSRTLD